MLDAKFEDVSVGTTFRSRGRTLTEADLLQFSMLTQDWADIHMDKEYAAKTRFGDRIAHAGLTLAIVAGLLPVPAGSPIEGFFGMHTVRFLAPVVLGDTVHVEVEIKAKSRRSDGRGIYEMDCEVRNSKDAVLLIAPLKAMVRLEVES